MLSDELVKKLKDYPAFTEFEEYIVEQIERLDSLHGLEHMTNEQAGEEAKVKAKARDVLFSILAPLLHRTDKQKATEEQIKRANKRFGL